MVKSQCSLPLHYSHYGRCIKMFGPPIAYWTGRFESRHRIAKSLAESAKNVVNITKTVSERQQMRAVSVYYHGMFNFSSFSLPEVVTSKKEIAEDSDFHNNLKRFMGDRDLICNNIVCNNQVFKNNDLIIVDITDCDNVDVGLIQTILIKENKVYFVIIRYKAKRNWFQYFESEKNGNPVCEFVESNKIVDFKPLIMRGTVNNFRFVFHHNVSYDYK